ncbi:MFS transporter [Mesorhizobium sp. LjNodule214]|uniref:MFS transporter n=1 Tax=Mesorhizobium sp. LjNodule214 TaxID=3342252 RepID=UPI003ED051F6
MCASAGERLSGAIDAWLTNGVQIGFVAGALASSLVNLPDIVRLNRLMAMSALLAAAANASLLLQPSPAGLVAARIVTGVALAGVYPPALKLVSTWFVRSRGLALGAVIGALTLGSALPHLFRALTGSFDWRLVVLAATAATVVGSFLFWFFAHEGPYPFGKAVFDSRQIGAIFRDRSLMLVNIGYLGHM